MISEKKPYQVNKASRYITERCKKDVEFLQKSPYGSGHARGAAGNRLVNKIVRANAKREARKEIEDSLYYIDFN
jgi:hypothetical protein